MITSGLEDYLELIHNSIAQNREIKAIDIANQFQISRSSVSEALIRLADLDLIIYEGRRGIKITQKGIEEAQKIARKHRVLSTFFTKIIGINEALANKNACKIEHVIDEELIEKIEIYTKNHE